MASDNVPLTAEEADVLRMLVGHDFLGTTIKGQAVAPPWLRHCVHVLQELAARLHESPAEVAYVLKNCDLACGIGALAHNSALAAILARPIACGPLRFHADGRVDLARSYNDWEPATDELLATLDSETRLGAPRTVLHEAAQLLLRWRGGHRSNDADADVGDAD